LKRIKIVQTIQVSS